MKRFLILFLLIAAPVSAQPWGYDGSWAQPMTPATSLVKAALDRGLCEQSGIAFIASQHQVAAAIAVPGKEWPCRDCVQWYGKGSGCDGKYQYVSADGPYAAGWEIKWDSNSWVDDGTPPPGFGTHHPTRWTFAPFAPASYTPAQPPPVIVTPPPVVSPPPIVMPPPPMVPPLDLSVVLARLDAIEQRIDAQTATLQAAIDHPAWISRILSNHYVQLGLASVGTWLATK